MCKNIWYIVLLLLSYLVCLKQKFPKVFPASEVEKVLKNAIVFKKQSTNNYH